MRIMNTNGYNRICVITVMAIQPYNKLLEILLQNVFPIVFSVLNDFSNETRAGFIFEKKKPGKFSQYCATKHAGLESLILSLYFMCIYIHIE